MRINDTACYMRRMHLDEYRFGLLSQQLKWGMCLSSLVISSIAVADSYLRPVPFETGDGLRAVYTDNNLPVGIFGTEIPAVFERTTALRVSKPLLANCSLKEKFPAFVVQPFVLAGNAGAPTGAALTPAYEYRAHNLQAEQLHFKSEKGPPPGISSARALLAPFGAGSARLICEDPTAVAKILLSDAAELVFSIEATRVNFETEAEEFTRISLSTPIEVLRSGAMAESPVNHLRSSLPNLDNGWRLNSRVVAWNLVKPDVPVLDAAIGEVKVSVVAIHDTQRDPNAWAFIELLIGENPMRPAKVDSAAARRSSEDSEDYEPRAVDPFSFLRGLIGRPASKTREDVRKFGQLVARLQVIWDLPRERGWGPHPPAPRQSDSYIFYPVYPGDPVFSAVPDLGLALIRMSMGKNNADFIKP